jgi:hypothetical protein
MHCHSNGGLTMAEAQHLADALKGLFGDPEHGLFTAFTVAVDGLTAAQAAAIPALRFNSIWAVVNHVRFWQEYTLLRPRGLTIDRQALGAANGCPPAGDPGDEYAWQTARTRALEVNQELAALIARMTDDEVVQPSAPSCASQ